ncbi:MAG: PPC domain-containing protein [Deltaproteobacteria bacterium]|nr:PPC domain-containing protein [Deltaproteobacteria bacterium]
MKNCKVNFVWLVSILLAGLLAGCSQGAGDPDPICGDDLIQGDELCDKTRLDGKVCADFGFDTGELGCLDDCTFDTSECEYLPDDCNNGQIDDGEDCDGDNLNETTCEDLGHLGGELACNADCTFDEADCEPNPCGDGDLDQGEECDGLLLDGWVCEDFGFTGGQLSCTDLCLLDGAACTGCSDDALEENDSLAAASPIDAGSHDLTMCNLDVEEDWFALDLVTDDLVLVRLSQAGPYVDLDLELTGADGLALASSERLGLEEELVYTALADGPAYLRVYTYAGMFGAVDYGLTIVMNPECVEHADCQEGEICQDLDCVDFVCSAEAECPDDLVCDGGTCVECISEVDCPEEDAYLCQDNACVYSCTDDANEPNSQFSDALDITVGFFESGLTLCGDANEDWYKVDLEALHRYELSLTFSHAQGDIEVEVYESLDRDVPVAIGHSDTDNETVTIAIGTDEDASYAIRVRQPAGDLAQTYDISLTDGGVVSCAWDADCPTEGDICEDFECVTPACTEDADCTAPERCVLQECVAQPAGDSCSAPNVVDSFPFTDTDVELAAFRDDLAFAEGICTEWGTPGKDAIYQVSLTAGQQLWANVTADFDVAVVISSQCLAVPALEDCLDGADDGETGESEQAYFSAEADGTVFVVVDSFAAMNPVQGTYTLTIEVE